MSEPPYVKIANRLKRGELSLFGKLFLDKNSGWDYADAQDVISGNFFDYFVCLPKHQKAVLNALNGGVSEFHLEGTEIPWCESEIIAGSDYWDKEDWYMDCNVVSRIKPCGAKQ